MLATGRTVVACASPGTQIADVVDQHGLVVPPGDAAAFCNAILELAGNQSLRESLGKATREYAMQNFGRKAILDQFFLDLLDVCNPGRNRDRPELEALQPGPGLQNGSRSGNSGHLG